MRHWREFIVPLEDNEFRIQAARCMDCGMPYCQDTGSLARHVGLPVNNQIPDWNDLVYSGDWKGRSQPALDQQLPGIHRPRVPGAVRGVVHPQHRREAGHHQVDRDAIVDRAGRRLGQPEPPTQKTGKTRRGRRLGPGGPCLRAAARARRPRRHVFEKKRQRRRPAALRHSRLQDGEAPHRPPRRADGGRRRGLPLRRRTSARIVAADELAAPSSTRWCWPAAPRSRATCRCPGASSTASISRWTSCRSRTGASPATRRRRQPILADRQARHRHRRRRYRLGLHRHLHPPGREDGHPVRDSCRSRRRRRTSRSPGRTGRLKLRTSSSHEEGAERDFAVRPRASPARTATSTTLQACGSTTRCKPIAGTEFEIEADLVLLAMGFVHPVHEGLVEELGVDARSARQRRAPTTDDYRTSSRQGVRRRRHAPGPVAGGLGDPRRPAGGPRGRQVPDGLDAAAALNPDSVTASNRSPDGAQRNPGQSSPPNPWRRSLHAGYLAAAALNPDRVAARNSSYRSPDGAKRNPGSASPPHPALRFAPCGLLAAYPQRGASDQRTFGAAGPMGDGGRIAPSRSARERRGERSGGVSGVASFFASGLVSGSQAFWLRSCRARPLLRQQQAAPKVRARARPARFPPRSKCSRSRRRAARRSCRRAAGGAGMASPRLSTRAASGSAAAPPGAGGPAAPKSSPARPRRAFRGTTGPMAGRPRRRGRSPVPARPDPVTRPGTGRFDITRRRSCST